MIRILYSIIGIVFINYSKEWVNYETQVTKYK